MQCDVMSEIASATSPLAQGWARIVGRVARLSLEETRVSRRGFDVDRPDVVQRLEAIGSHFAYGYNLALRSCRIDELVRALEVRAPADAGFAYEGAAMGLAIADWMTPGRHLFEAFLAGPARQHEYMVWVGQGWALARLPVSPLRALRTHRGLNKWLALDGWGFHEGYFHWRRSNAGRRRPRLTDADALRVFDQGLGRSLWFVFGARPDAVSDAISVLPSTRHADLWSGVGLAAAYAGCAPPRDWTALRAAAGPHMPALAQGVVFAAQARQLAGNNVPHTEWACQSLLKLDSASAATIALECLPRDDDSLQAYQSWRGAIQQRCAGAASPA